MNLDDVTAELARHGASGQPNTCMCKAVIHDESEYRSHLAWALADKALIADDDVPVGKRQTVITETVEATNGKTYRRQVTRYETRWEETQ